MAKKKDKKQKKDKSKTAYENCLRIDFSVFGTSIGSITVGQKA